MKRIPNFSGYSVTKDGRVYSHKSDMFISIQIRFRRNRNNARVKLIDDNGCRRTMYVHRLVAMAYLPNLENKATVNHKDFDTLNNHVDNLEWMTMEENIAHAKENGISIKYVFSLSDIAEILELNRSGYNIGDIAKKYGCSNPVIKNVFNKENVKPITHHKKKISEYEVRKKYLQEYKKPQQICEELGVSSISYCLKDIGIETNWHTFICGEINKMYSSGLSVDYIANTTRLDSSYVRSKINILREEDLFDVTTQYGIPTDRYDEFISLVLKRYSRDELKKHFNVGDNALDTALRKNNLKIIRDSGKYDIKKLYEMSLKMPQSEIAKIYGVSQPTIGKKIAKYKRNNGIKVAGGNWKKQE